MKSRIVVSALILLALALAGCGGGGGGGTSTAIIPSSTTRQIQAGDRLVYSLTGATKSSVTGTLTITASNGTAWSTLPGRHIELTETLDCSVDGHPYINVVTVYMTQTTDGAQYDLGADEIKLQTYTGAPIMFQGSMSTGQTWSYSATYSDSSSDTTHYSVIGTERVAGYDCFKLQCATTSTTGDSFETTWFSPDLGYPVKSNLAIQLDETTRLDLVGTLTSKNF